MCELAGVREGQTLPSTAPRGFARPTAFVRIVEAERVHEKGQYIDEQGMLLVPWSSRRHGRRYKPVDRRIPK
jgi:hypothetical protein